MKKRLFHCTLAISLGLALAALLLWLDATSQARADPDIYYHTSARGEVAVTTAAGAPGWSLPLNVSGWYTIGEGMWLEMGADGTQAAFWLSAEIIPTLQAGLWTRVRSPDGDWSAAENLTGWLTPTTLLNPAYWSVGVAPDGTAWAVWTIIDGAQPGDNVRVKVAHRPPGGTWQSDDLSEWWHTVVRAAELHIGPDGDLAAAWVECASTSSDLRQGPCAMNVRRRPAGATAWETTKRLDGSSGMGIAWPHVLVGPGGLTAVIWAEANPLNPSQWGVKARAYLPSSGTWEGSIADVSNGWIEPRQADEDWLSQPVMGADGTVVAAWNAKTSPGSAQDAQYSSTRAAAAGTWSLPTKISADYDADSLEVPWLAVGQNGTAVVAWECESGSSNRDAIFANARDPGGIWGSEVRVSDWMNDTDLADLGVWAADGTAMVLWAVEDTSRITTADEALFWSARPPHGAWGGGGEGRLGNWVAELNGAALALGDDGSATALWGVIDADQPARQQGSVVVAAWPPGGPWGAPAMLADGYKAAYAWRYGMVVGPGGHPVAVIWLAVRDVATPYATPSYAIFYSQWPEWQLFLPLVLRSYP
jgi:hypothetical protein